MSRAKTVLLIVLGLNCSVAADELLSNVEITPFLLNPSYGISPSADSASEGMSKYMLWSASGDRTGGRDFTVLDSISSISLPQLCDTNAVSYIVQHGKDSAALMVKELGAPTPSDTIVTYPVEQLGSSFSWAPGQGRLYNMDRYLLYRPDSLLFWGLPDFRRSIIEFGRILPDGSYESVDGCFECSLPRFVGDFSMALYAKYAGVPVFKGPTVILTYDFALDTSYVLRLITGECGSPQLLDRTDQLYCICDIGSNGFTSICRVEDSIPIPLFSVEYPVTFLGYDVYRDSIVVRTQNCCDADYGVQTYVILR